MANAQSEPSMDEILASIRRIISEDEEAAPGAESAAAAPAVEEPAPEPEEAAAEEPSGDDISKLQAALKAADFQSPAPAEPEFEAPEPDAVENIAATPDPVAAQVSNQKEEAETMADSALDPAEILMTQAPEEPVLDLAVEAEEVTLEAEKPSLANLSTTAQADESAIISGGAAAATAGAFEALAENVRIADGEGTTLEALVERMVEPMLKQWLDANLPRIVEEKVEEEVRRLARRR